MTEYSKKVIILISNFVETMKKLNINTDSETEEDRGKQLHAILQLENDIEEIFIQ